MSNQNKSPMSSCEVCGKKDLSLRFVEFQRAKRRFVEQVDSVVAPLCPRHRLGKGAGLAARALFLDLFNVGFISMWGIAFENIRGGRVVPGDTAALMEQLASDFDREGNAVEAAKASKLAQKYTRQMDQEIATLERAQLDAERRWNL